MRYKEWIQSELKEKLRKLYPLENQEWMLQKFIRQWLLRLTGIMCVTVLLIVMFLLTGTKEENLKEGNILKRPQYGENSLDVKIKANIKAEGVEPEELFLEIEAEKYTREEFEGLVMESIPKLEESILGNNVSLEEITENMVLPEILFDTPIAIRWDSENEDVLKRSGELNQNRSEEADQVVLLTAVFTYEEYKISHTFGVVVKKQELSVQEKITKRLFLELEKAFEATQEEKEIILPKEIDGITVVYEEEKADHKSAVIFFIMTGILLWGIALKEELESMEKQREKQLLVDYPGLISQFTLLLSAGLTVSGAWKKIIDQYEMQRQNGWKKRRYVYEEMIITLREMQNGISEVDAIGRFGARIRLTPYLKFSTLLTQNIRKGSRGLTALLKVEEKLAYEERKEIAKRLGEEAGTKLLVPMFMMFGIVMVVILVPAFSTF